MPRSPFMFFALAVSWLLAASQLTAAERQVDAAAAPPIAHQSSGIGDDDPLATIVGDYNVQLVFATQGSGEYLADIRVLIVDAQGHTLLDEKSPGPLFFVRLPAGSYRISADFNGTPVRKAVAVSDRRRQNLYFYWPREAIEKGRL